MKSTNVVSERMERNRSLGFAERMSIARKLSIMLAVPLIGLVVFASLQVSEKLNVVRNMSQLEDYTGVAVAGSTLLHELQRERGRAVRVAAAGERDSADLQAQRPRTDEALVAFRDAVARTTLEGNVARAAEASLPSAQDLGSLRSAISAGTARPPEIMEFFSARIDALLALNSAVVETASAANIAIALTSLDALMRMKEVAGRERAFVSIALVGSQALAVDGAELGREVGLQDGYATLFLARASSDTGRMFQERMSGSFATEVARGRTDAFNLATHGRQTGPAATAGAASAQASPGTTMDADTWWRASTPRIDAIRELEQSLSNQILAAVVDLKSSASFALGMYALLATICTVAAMFISWVFAREMIRSFTQASDMLREVVTQIAGFVRQQSSATSETATSVSQTTSTVEELRKTAETASSRAIDMTDTAKQSKAASEQALTAVTHGTDAMQQIRSEVEGIAENILDLSEKNIQIGEIVQSVNAIAEQSNLLAVNASIEAAKAGEHGKGFSVVAGEVKALAAQSKRATDQIRALLAEIQKSSNGAVMITEQGVKRVEEGSGLIEELGRTIRNLGTTVEDNSEVANQISLISTQQLSGIEQITEAMRNIGAATAQNAEGARQLETAADQVRLVSLRILEIVQGRRTDDASLRSVAYS